MKNFPFKLPHIACTAAAVAGLTLFGISSAWAQEKHKFFFKVPPGVAKYTQQHAIDVGDVPGHQIRIFEVNSKYTAEAPVYDGVKVVEGWGRQYSDYTNGSGNSWGYSVSLLENGDKIFSRVELLAHTKVSPDGARTFRYTSVTTLTGGTGRFKSIRGTLLNSGDSDLKTGLSNVQTEGEYWFEK